MFSFLFKENYDLVLIQNMQSHTKDKLIHIS